jgi:hypothetical protein
MRLFKLNKETSLAELTDEARTLEPYKTLARRVKGMVGDADGRKKLLNEKEIAYVYFAANYDSNLKYAKDEEKLLILKKRLELPDNWVPDEVVKDAIKTWIKDQETISTPIYESAVKAGKALKGWFDYISQDITENPQKYKANVMKDFQDNFARLGTTLEQIKAAGEKVRAEHETKTTNKGRLISKFEMEE